MKYFLWILLLISFEGFSQNVRGYLYNSKAVIPNFPILNTRTDTYFETAKTGYFEVEAQVGDTLQFKSMAYKSYMMIVKPKDFNQEIVVELQINELDEVALKLYKKQELNVEELDTKLSYSIQKDIENYPFYYKPSGGNILAVIDLVVGIFKKKHKTPKQEKVSQLVTYNDFKEFFETDSFFNEAYLEDNLKIPKKYHQLFFNYLSTKYITSDLLNDKKQLEFIEKLISAKNEFLQNLDEFSAE
ncbi:hypothetical protein [Zunongwangia sp.]|uniref:hypothetical protein n=1 Tax=Zunongwangia sp. TaxID=1965325 RepID=UPI003AA8518C